MYPAISLIVIHNLIAFGSYWDLNNALQYYNKQYLSKMTINMTILMKTILLTK